MTDHLTCIRAFNTSLAFMASWWRRFVNSDGRFEHEPVPIDEHDEDGSRPPRYAQEEEDRTPGWLKWILSGGLVNGNPYPGDYRPPVEYDPQLQIHDNEEAQIELAIRESLQEEALREEMEKDEHALRRAMEQSQKEAELAARNNELAIIPAVPPAVNQIPDLPDLLDFGPDPSVDKDLMLLQDEEVARKLQQQMDLLDMSGPGESSGGELAILPVESQQSQQPGHLGFPEPWKSTPSSQTPAHIVPQAFLGLPPPVTPAQISPFSVICVGCNRPIGSGRYFTSLGQSWHATCFKCTLCGETISEREVKFVETDPYHTQCHRQLFHPKCTVCDDYVESQPGGVIEYRSVPFWGQDYCPVHDVDGTPRCSGCSRLENRGTPYVDLADGRKLCLSCVDSVVIDSSECAPIMETILDFYDQLGLTITQRIPLLCVETQALNAAREAEPSSGHQGGETLGLCLTEEHTIQTVYRLPGFPSHGLGIGQKSRKLHRHCEVTAIIILYGLPRVVTESVLAHEVMHAYLKLNGKFPALSPEVEEGLCQIMSHLWLQSRFMDGGVGDRVEPIVEYQMKLKDFLLHQIMAHPSKVYGDGFRAAHKTVSEFGLKQTLDHVQLTGSLPEI